MAGGPPSCPSDPLAPAAVPHSRGDLRTSAPGAYLPAASASGTCAHRRAARAARRPDPMDQPSLQTSKPYIGAVDAIEGRASARGSIVVKTDTLACRY